MDLKDITPIMTSNNSPAPYKVYSSSHDSTNTGTEAFYAFRESSSWLWGSGVKIAWIDLWFENETTVDYIKIFSDYSPKSFAIYGTNDRKDFTLISEPETNYNNEAFIQIPRSKYKCYRILVTAKQGDSYTKHEVKRIYFYRDRELYNISKIIKEKIKDTLSKYCIVRYTEKGD